MAARSSLLFSVKDFPGKELDSYTPGSPFEGIPRRKYGLESLRVPRTQEPLGHEFSVDSLLSGCKLMEYL